MASTQRSLLAHFSAAAAMLIAVCSYPVSALAETKFKQVPTQYIAALADPSAKSGTGAETWGIWRLDPGPRGVRLGSYEALKAHGGKAPSDWQFDAADWWLEENGLIMEKPQFPMPPGKYLVTGGREATSVLTVFPKDADGKQRWELAGGVTVYDVTHLRCRSVRYTPEAGKMCSPAAVRQSGFPVEPGAAMPPVENCGKQDYAVLFIIGVEG